MTRGTTPVVKFNLPMEIDFDVLYITFKQGSDIVFEKELEDVTKDGTTLFLPLSQAETLLFDRRLPVWVQLRGRVGNIAYASKIMRISVSEILKEGEI
jgi:hypothetical protein